MSTYREIFEELVETLQPTSRLDLKTATLKHILDLTGSPGGKRTIVSLDFVITALFNLTTDASSTISKDSVLTLINLTADLSDALHIFNVSKQPHSKFELIPTAVKHITDKDSELADPWCMVLSNLTRVEELACIILDELEEEPNNMLLLANAFAKLDYNKKNANLHHLASIFCNLTRRSRACELFCFNKYNLLDKVLPFASYKESVVRRRGAIGILRNICFNPVYHNIILREADDILYAILYPLCGPEEFTDEENEKLPLQLQYLPETKTREKEPELRKMLLEALLQLCSTKSSRDKLRQKGVYEILREYHKWEAKTGKDKECLLACENVVDILIRREYEIGVDNYINVEVPDGMAEKFVKEDQDYLKDLHI